MSETEAIKHDDRYVVEVNQPVDGDTCEAFIQWKGTDVCLDVYCPCGADVHFDGMFAYAVRCWSCQRVWSLPSMLILVEGEPSSKIIQNTQEDTS